MAKRRVTTWATIDRIASRTCRQKKVPVIHGKDKVVQASSRGRNEHWVLREKGRGI